MAVAIQRRLLDTLDAVARALVVALDADACGISRVVGDVLLLVTTVTAPGRTLATGAGYLISDYPMTDAVLESGTPHAVCLLDDDPDAAETEVLRDLGYSSLLMLPLVLVEGTWGLVEVYRDDARPFGAEEIRAAASILGHLR